MASAGPAPIRRAGKLLQLALHGCIALPRVWRLFEHTLVALRHQFPGSAVLSRLSYHWLVALTTWRPGEMSRIATLPGGIRLAILLRDGWHRGLYFRGVYEPETTALIRRLLKKGDVFLDVGANIGYYACIAAGCGAWVHAFEANPALVRQCELSRSLNRFGDRLTINPVAVAGGEGTADFYVSPQEENTGLSSLLPMPHLATGHRLSVRTISLDAYCRTQQIHAIRLLKIDVEGAELTVLSGARTVLTDIRPDAIICEVGGFAEGCTPAELLHALTDAGYTPHEIAPDGTLVPFTDAETALHRPAQWVQRNLCFLNGAHESTGSHQSREQEGG